MNYASDNFPSNSVYMQYFIQHRRKDETFFQKAIPFEAFLNVRNFFLKLNAKGLMLAAQHWQLWIVQIRCSSRYRCDSGGLFCCYRLGSLQ